jgi:hypothetical protein
VTGTGACGEIRVALGVYVLGAIGPADRNAVDVHLACCADCRDELAGLAGLPAVLGRVPVGDVDSLVLDGDDGSGSGSRHELPPDPGLRSLLGRAASHRMWSRLAAAAAGLIAGAGAVAASERYRTNPDRARRAIMGKSSGGSAR